ncbi:hypothetical protein RA268_28305, partial [Pseudomonas syringae pv. tagetis]
GLGGLWWVGCGLWVVVSGFLFVLGWVGFGCWGIFGVVGVWVCVVGVCLGCLFGGGVCVGGCWFGWCCWWWWFCWVCLLGWGLLGGLWGCV